MNFNSILIGSEDPQRLADYYTKLFGEPQMSDGGYTGWQIGGGFVTVWSPRAPRSFASRTGSSRSGTRSPRSLTRTTTTSS